MITARVVLRSPLSHIGDTTGIDAEFNRMKIIHNDEPIAIPYVSGNGVRGLLRDMSALYMLNRINADKLTLQAFYALFSGGSLTKSGGGRKDMDYLNSLRHYIPPLGLWGAALQNQIMEGVVRIGMMIPAALETTDIIPSAFHREATLSVYDLMQSQSYTRKDDAKNVNYQDRFESDELDMTVQQMRYNIETMSAGTVLYWHFDFIPVASTWHELAFVSALTEWAKYPALGGKSGVGHGLCDIECGNGWFINTRGDNNLPDLDEYDTFLTDNRGTILELLDEF